MRNRTFFRATALLGILILAACTDAEITGLEREAIGSYRLKWVNGEELPMSIGEQEAHLVDILDGRVTLRADKTCDYSHTYILTSLEDQSERTVVDDADTCTWKVDRVALHLRFPSTGGTISAIRSAQSLWFSYAFNPPVNFVYDRDG